VVLVVVVVVIKNGTFAATAKDAQANDSSM